MRMLLLGSFLTLNYVVLPLLLGLLYKGLKTNNKIYLIYIVLVSIVFSNLNFALIAIDIIVCIIFITYLFFVDKKLRIRSVLFFVFPLLILSILTASWWVAPQLFNISTNNIISTVLKVETPQSYDKYSSFLETGRLLGELGYYGSYRGVPYVNFAKKYIENNFFIFSTMLFAIVAVFGFIIKKNLKKTLFFLILLCCFLPLAVGVYTFDHPTINNHIYQWLYDNVPYFGIFRNGFKCVAILSFVYSVMFAFTIDYFFRRIQNKNLLYRGLSIIYLVFVFAIIIMNSVPLWSGKIFFGRTVENVPAYWYKITDYLNLDKTVDRIIITPSLYASVYSWGNPESSLARALVDKGVIEVEKADYGYKRFNRLIVNSVKDADTFNYILKIGNIKYVIQRNDIDVGYYENTDSDEKMKQGLEANNRLEYIKDFGELSLYKVKEEYITPRLFVPSNLNYIQGDLETSIRAFSFDSGNLRRGYLTKSGMDLELKKGFLDGIMSSYLFNELDNIIIPVEPNPDYLSAQQLVVDKTTDPAEKKKLQNELDLYASKTFIKDYRLSIPSPATYKIYFKKDSILANNLNTSVKINDRVLKKDELGKETEGWNYFSQVELDKGEYDLKLYIGETLINAINSGDIVLAAENLVDPIKTPELEYRQINPTKYIVNVTNASESFPLIFSESYHPAWKIYVAPDLAGQGTGQFISENNQGTVQNDNLNGGHFYDLMFRKPVLDDKHLLINGFANAWWIDINELAKQGKITKNADGTYNFSVYIEFEPQKYFYIGLGISGITLIGCLTYLGWDFVRRRKERKIKGATIEEKEVKIGE